MNVMLTVPPDAGVPEAGFVALQKIRELSGGASEDEAERRSRAFRAANTGETCGRCGRNLKPDETVWRERCAKGPSLFGGQSFILAPVCEACRSPYHRNWYSAACMGCGRPVKWNGSGIRYVACCSVCRERARRKARSDHRAEMQERACPICEEIFVPTRNDAVTCSSACRQKAYRRRVTVLAPARAAWTRSRNEGLMK